MSIPQGSTLRSCLLDALASAWVDLYYASPFVTRQSLAKEQEQIRVALVQKELLACEQQLQRKEAEMHGRIEVLGKEAILKRNAKDLMGAKKKMLERRRMQGQLEKLQNSIMTIELHRNTIEGSVLDRTVLETLRASGDALRQIGASTAGLKAVEEIVSDVQQEMENAAEITKILSTGSVTGMINTMAVDGIAVDEDELMQELEEMVNPKKLAEAEVCLPDVVVQTKPTSKKTKVQPPQMLQIEEEEEEAEIQQMEEADTSGGSVRRLLQMS